MAFLIASFGNQCFAYWKDFFLKRPLCARRCSRCCESIVATLYSECMIYPRCIALMQGGTFSSIDTFYQTTTTTTTKKTRTTMRTMFESIWEQTILKMLLQSCKMHRCSTIRQSKLLFIAFLISLTCDKILK